MHMFLYHKPKMKKKKIVIFTNKTSVLGSFFIPSIKKVKRGYVSKIIIEKCFALKCIYLKHEPHVKNCREMKWEKIFAFY